MGSIAPAVEHAAPNIIDIRSDSAGIDLRQEILDGLGQPDGAQKYLPTLLLYDDKGLQLFEKITYLDEYYLTGQEIEVLETHAGRMAQRFPQDAMLVELGSGNLRKIKILLDALDKAGKRISYYALDVMRSELERTLLAVPDGTYKHVTCSGLHGTYDDGLVWLNSTNNQNRAKVIMSMGSSLGNFTREAAVEFVRSFADTMKSDDALLIGVDACQDADKVYHAYNDRHGVTREFDLNGLRHANRLLGFAAFNPAEWETFGEFSPTAGGHQAFVIPKHDVGEIIVLGNRIRAGERVKIEQSLKYNSDAVNRLWNSAGVIQGARWYNSTGDYALHMLKRPDAMYPMKAEDYAPRPVPSLDEWNRLWAAWDVATQHMIPKEELLSKPIKLRNACIFYLGHIPTFLDMKITEGTGGKPTEPKQYYKIFERGIDPDVDNPEHCHAHSEIPDTWPPLSEMLEFQQRVRERVASLYKSGQAYDDLWTGRVLWLGFEHEVMHLETLLYMLLQSNKTLPPAQTVMPDFEQLALQAKRDAVENKWFEVPAQRITLGINDPENADGPVRHFGWDVEKPQRVVDVAAFKAKGRPITVGEYAKYMIATGKTKLPTCWMEFHPEGLVNGDLQLGSDLDAFVSGKAHRTVYGPVPLKYALDWPMSASYDELLGCAKYMGGRIPTLEEARSIYYYVDEMQRKEAMNARGETIPAVNGHLINEGVEETPPSKPSQNGVAGPNPTDLFVNLEEANVGFKHWHPMPVTQKGGRLSGQGDMGGVWEWTSSTLEKQDGFEPMKLYPAFSADFFDEKHNVMLGGSWATHPRLAGRKSFVNWYQRNYPYVWAGARLVKDA